MLYFNNVQKGHMAEVLQEISHNINETFKECLLERNVVNCTDILKTVQTDAGEVLIFLCSTSTWYVSWCRPKLSLIIEVCFHCVCLIWSINTLHVKYKICTLFIDSNVGYFLFGAYFTLSKKKLLLNQKQ